MPKTLAIGVFLVILGSGPKLLGQPPAPDPPEQTRDTGSSERPAEPEEPTLMRRTGSTMSRPAEFQGPGLLQLEWSYDGSFGGRDLRRGQTGTVSLGFAVFESLLLEVGFDAAVEQADWLGGSASGAGDVHAGLQWALLGDGPRQPAVSLAYLSKLPSASVREGLGTGRTDHKFALLLSKTLGSEELDCSVGLLVNGRDDAPGFNRGGLLAVSWGHTLPRGFASQVEFARLTLDADLPKGSYGLTALTFQVTRLWQLDAGVRFGLTPDTPDIGIFAGSTLGVANLYRRKRQ